MPNVDEIVDEVETDTDSGNQSGGDEQEEKRFTQADLDKHISERLERERKKAEKAQAKAKEEAEAKQLEEQAKWQELAQKRQAKVDELTSKVGELEASQERVQALETAVASFLTSLKANIGSAQLELLEQLPTEKQLAWLTKHGASLGSNRGIPDTPNPNSGETLTEKERSDRAYRPSF